MKIEIESAKQFEDLLTALAQEVVDANIHWHLLQDLKGKAEEYSRELNESATFWSQTFQAHLQATIFILIRVYDGNSKVLSLRNLLDTIEANITIFDKENFKERLKDNVFVESLAEDVRKPNAEQLGKDIEFSSDQNEVVNKLQIWRGNLFAHKSAKNVLSGKDITSEYPLNTNDIGILVKGSIDILNRYSQLFKAETYSTQMIGHDDYQFVLDSLRYKLKAMKKELEDDAVEVILKEMNGES